MIIWALAVLDLRPSSEVRLIYSYIHSRNIHSRNILLYTQRCNSCNRGMPCLCCSRILICTCIQVLTCAVYTAVCVYVYCVLILPDTTTQVLASAVYTAVSVSVDSYCCICIGRLILPDTTTQVLASLSSAALVSLEKPDEVTQVFFVFLFYHLALVEP
jgi:hypothetical protein